ncbi:MAG: Hint domain-containing protein [Pseudomonadota bacterium]
MAFLYIYSPDDFVDGLPDEKMGGSAEGTPNFFIQLKPGAQPTLIEVADASTVFNESGGGQTLAQGVTFGGVGYAAGTPIRSAYDLLNSGNGHKVTSFHFTSNGGTFGAVDGLVSTVELVPGTSYGFDSARTSQSENNLFEDYFACFAAGTLIATDTGELPIETLAPGALLLGQDGTRHPLRLAPGRHLSADDLARLPNLRPVRIGAGSLGQGLPHRDLWVSPQHRMLVRSAICARMFGLPEVLVAAKWLTALPGIAVDDALQSVSYHHLVLDRHAVILAEGAPSESLYLGPVGFGALDPESRCELSSLFPDLVCGGAPAPARSIPDSKDQRLLIARHAKNAKPLLATP